MEHYASFRICVALNAQKEGDYLKNSSLQRLTISAVMIALSTALSFVKIFTMPLGGSITLLSMLPVCMLAIMYGTRWGLSSAFVYSFVQLVLDIGVISGWGLTPQALIGSVIFDYLVAFSVLGFSGLFRTKGVAGYIGGISLAIGMRIISHVISGVIFFGSWAPDGWNPLIYSLCYNSSYMIPEAVFTFVGAVVLLKEPHLAKFFKAYPISSKRASH